MKTIAQTITQLTDNATITRNIKAILMQVDPQFPEQEAQYTAAAAKLKACWCHAEDYLCAREACYAAAVIHMLWQGLYLNCEIFHHPIYSFLLQGNLDRLYQEENLALLPPYLQAQEAVCAFDKPQPENIHGLLDDISDYYAYLETVGYKVAHYYGYRLADSFLRHVIPGYTGNPAHSALYKHALNQYLQIDLSKLD